MYLIFEGLDKTGKTTIIEEINKRTKYKYITRDRGAAGWIAYDMAYSRSTESRYKRYLTDARAFTSTNDYLVIYCKTSWPMVQKRLKDHGEEADYDYLKAQKIYDDCVYSLYPHNKIIDLDTTNITIDVCVEKVLKATKLAELENYESTEKSLVISIYSLGSLAFEILSSNPKAIKHMTEKEAHKMLDAQLEGHKKTLSIIRDGKQVNIALHEYPYHEFAFVDESLFGKNSHKEVVCKVYNMFDPYKEKVYTADFLLENNRVAGLPGEDLDITYHAIVSVLSALRMSPIEDINLIVIDDDSEEKEEKKTSSRNDKKGKSKSDENDDDEFVFDA